MMRIWTLNLFCGYWSLHSDGFFFKHSLVRGWHHVVNNCVFIGAWLKRDTHASGMLYLLLSCVNFLGLCLFHLFNSLARAYLQTHPPITSIFIFSTAQRENKSQQIQAPHRRKQIPARAWQTTSKFEKSRHRPSPRISVCWSKYPSLLLLHLCTFWTPRRSSSILHLCSRTCQTSSDSQAVWAQRHTSRQCNVPEVRYKKRDILHPDLTAWHTLNTVLQ